MEESIMRVLLAIEILPRLFFFILSFLLSPLLSSGSAVFSCLLMSSSSSSAHGGRKLVAYFYDDEIGNAYYGPGHPMKPHRIRMAHNLILAYGLYKKMEIYRPTLMSEDQMTKFHSDDYIHFLQHVTPDNMNEYSTELARYNADVDCKHKQLSISFNRFVCYINTIICFLFTVFRPCI